MARCSMKECELPAFCRPVLVVRDVDPTRHGCALELPLVLCCRHARPGSVDRYLSPSTRKRIQRALRGQRVRVDWRRSAVELRWSAPPALRLDAAPLALA